MICGKSIFNNEADYIDLIKAGIIRQIESHETLNETLTEILQSDKAMLQAIIKGQKMAQEACMRPAKAAHYIISTIEK
jgi:3-deoxy-D-manno-octulosonic-acid transferase